MKKITYSVAFVATLLATSNTFAQQGFGTNTPHRSAAVEIQSTNKGLLIPRVALNSETQKLNTSVDNANSLLIYNTGTTLPKGYYYWDAEYVVTPAQGNTAAVTGKWVAFSTAEGATYTANNGIAKTEGLNNFELGTNPIFKATNLNISSGGSLTIISTTAPFTIASGNNNFGITGLAAAPSNDFVPQLLVQNGASGTVYNYSPNALIDRFLKGKNGITIALNENTAELEVKLGGTIDEVTNLHIADNASVSVTGLKRMDGTAVTPTGLDASVAALGGNSVETGHLIPVGTTMNGTLKVATAKEIVDAGIVSVTNIITPAVHTPASGENPGSTTEGTLVTKVNDDTSVAVDMTALVQSVQKTYRFTSNNQSVAINETLGSNANGYVNTIDLAVSTDNIEGAGSLTSDDLEIPTNTALLADLEINIKNEGVKANHINVNVAGQGLVQEASGALKVNVNNGLEYGTANTADATGDFVQLGGDLTRATTLTTSETNTLAIAGLRNVDGSESPDVSGTNHASVVVDKDGKLRTIETQLVVNTTTFPTDVAANYEEITFNVASPGTITLPAPGTVKGQIVNVIITANLNDYLLISGTGGSIALNPADHGSTANDLLGYGEILGQRWTIKSDGTNWIVTARM